MGTEKQEFGFIFLVIIVSFVAYQLGTWLSYLLSS